MKRSHALAVRILYALVLPVSIQVMAILLLNDVHKHGLGTARGFAMTAIIWTFFWGLLVLVPTTLAQLGCAWVLIKSKCPAREMFLIGMLNPSLAIVLLIVSGLIA